MQDILIDSPLTDLAKDELEYEQLAEAFSNLIRNYKHLESFVFAVTGLWGSGKTTFLNFVEKKLQEEKDDSKDNKKYYIFRFNPWMFSSKKEGILKQFIEHFIYFLEDKFKDGDITFNKQILYDLHDFANILSPQKFTIDFKIVRFDVHLQRTASKIQENINYYFRSYFENNKGKIIVIIDDIDRLNDEEIRELFTIIKTIANFNNIIYILAYDEKVVINALNKSQKKNGKEYLEKIVNFTFKLPKIEPLVIRGMLIEYIGEILELGNESARPDFIQVIDEGILNIVNSVRKVKKLRNELMLTYPLVKDDVDPVDFLAIETIRIFFPEIYELISQNKELLCDDVYYEDNFNDQRFKKDLLYFWNSIGKFISDKNPKDGTMKLIYFMFNKKINLLKSTEEKKNKLAVFYKKFMDDLLLIEKPLAISKEKNFDRYFILRIPNNDFSREGLLNVLNKKEKEIIKSLEEWKEKTVFGYIPKSRLFLIRLKDYFDNIPYEKYEKILNIILCTNIKYFYMKHQELSFELPTLIMDLLIRIIRNHPLNDKILINSFVKCEDVSYSHKIYQTINSYLTQQPEELKYNTFKKDTLNQIQEILIEKIENLLDNNQLQNEPFSISIIEWYMSKKGNEKVREWFLNNMAEGKFLDFVSTFCDERINEEITQSDIMTLHSKLITILKKLKIDKEFFDKLHTIIQEDSIPTDIREICEHILKQYKDGTTS